MKTLKTLLVITIAVIGFNSNSFAQSTASATASVKIQAALTIDKTTDLNFGGVYTNASAKTVILATDGSRSGTATLAAGTPVATAAVFAITGTPDAAIAITLPTSVDIIKTGGSGANMTATDWTHNAGGSPAISGAGTLTLRVGATLNVGAAQVVNTYQGSFDVTINYN